MQQRQVIPPSIRLLTKPQRIFLTGGFGRNPYLFSRVSEFGRNKGIAVEGNSDG
jgi:hypothetical protein